MNAKTSSDVLCRWVRLVREHAWPTIVLCFAVSLVALVLALTLLGIDSDTIELFPEDHPARRNHAAFVALFPDLENALLIVIDAESPETARESAERLASRLRADSEHFEDAYVSGGGSFFEENALLYQSVDNLDRFGDHLVRMQPVVGELERDGSIANLSYLVQRGRRTPIVAIRAAALALTRSTGSACG